LGHRRFLVGQPVQVTNTARIGQEAKAGQSQKIRILGLAGPILCRHSTLRLMVEGVGRLCF
jgi:hypothetical protein